MKLIELWNADINLSYELFSKFPCEENGFENPAYGMDLDMFRQYVKLSYDYSLGKNMRPGHVPDSKYVLVDDDNKYIGIFKLRHELNDSLRNNAGHIGYGILKEYRGKGFASKGLALVLEKAKEKGIKEAYLSCNKDNEASLKVMLKNGGYIHHEDNKCYYVRINLL